MNWFLALLITPCCILMRGFVLCKLWEWFAVTQFHLSPLHFAAALGLAVIVDVLTLDAGSARDSEWKESPVWMKGLGYTFGYAITLFWGWIIHLFL